uniref:Lipocalin n=1 Tax=Rhipicephalus appendiculatus TaxID=34631 RepID=A0A131YFI8_RHIAP
MYPILLTILCTPYVSSHEIPKVEMKMWQLYDLLNTTKRIWILSISQPVIYEGKEAECINYRTKNLTTTDVTLLYKVVLVKEVRKFKVNATIQTYTYPTYPSMKMKDWNGINVVKVLIYWGYFSRCGIFFVMSEDDPHAVPWCEVHVQGPQLRAAYSRPPYSYTACDKKFYELCGQHRKQIFLAHTGCPNVTMPELPNAGNGR